MPPAEAANARPVSMQETGDATAELSQAVDELLNNLRNTFSTVSNEILARMDDMTRRLDDIEAALQMSPDSGRRDK